MERVNITPKSMDAQEGRKTGHAEIIEKTELLSPEQKEAVRQLIEVCRAQDDVRLSYPMEPDMAESHYLLWKDQDRQLLSVLAFVPYDETGAECIAFTHPKYRNRGCFSRLLTQVVEDYEDCDILFPVSGECEDTMAALQALGAELESCEHQMQRELDSSTYMESKENKEDTAYAENTAHVEKTAYAENAARAENIASDVGVQAAEKAKLVENAEGQCGRKEIENRSGKAAGNFLKGDVAITFYPWGYDCAAAGMMRTSPVSEHGVCLHHVEIFPEFRGRGMGKQMICLLLERLAECHVRTVILQVSSDNLSALRLYEKTGFQITETLSYYLY